MKGFTQPDLEHLTSELANDKLVPENIDLIESSAEVAASWHNIPDF